MGNNRRRFAARSRSRHYAKGWPLIRSRRPAGDSIAPVTVLADEPEKSRIDALAAVVKAPRIEVIPASEGVNECTHRPADFVVDTLQDPTRLGPAIPLFSERLIIIARDVTDIRKLRGQHVSFGLPGGSSERTAQRLFQSLGIGVHNIPLDADNALDALASGNLDAVALLVPRGYDKLAKHDPNLHLISLDDGMVPPDGLKVSQINPASYLGGSWPSKPIEVIAVDAVLSPNPKAAAQEQSAVNVYAALDRRASALARNGFDLIGGDAVVTMRSVARDVDSTPAHPLRAHADSARNGC